jgi:hypothetical protein
MLLLLLVALLLVDLAHLHVIWMSPPARQNIGHLRPQCRLPVDYDRSSTYCGGFAVQHNAANRGRCAICGDEFSAAVKPHQTGGPFATGTLAASYMPGQQVDITLDLTANHRGFFSFALCPNNNPSTDPGPECFRQYRLQVVGGGNGGLIMPATAGTGIKRMTIKLPDGLTCSQCILQMTYTTGNNWGAGPQSAEVQTEACTRDRTGRLGCGPQETFRGCADICIGASCPTGECAKATSGPPGPPGQTPLPFTATPTAAPSDAICMSAGIHRQYYSRQGDAYCRYYCLNRPRADCMAAPNTAFLCYCNRQRSQPRSLPSVREEEEKTICNNN